MKQGIIDMCKFLNQFFAININSILKSPNKMFIGGL